MDQANNFETGCCPRFNPEPWQEKEVIFNEKLFLKDRIKSLFHIPLNFGKVMEQDLAKIEKAGAQAEDPITLTDEKSIWGTDVFIAIDKEVPEAEMEKISGIFLTKVFEGPYKNMGKWIEEMKNYVASKGKEEKKLYFYYTYCPECAKAYVKNYTVILAQV